MGLWASRKAAERRSGQQTEQTFSEPMTRGERSQAFASGAIRPTKRARSKQLKDRVHMEMGLGRRLERARLFDEAIRGRDESRGEVVADSGSDALDVSRGDVLVDRRIHGLPGGYVHPSLQPQPIMITAKDMVDSIRKKAEVGTQTLKGDESKKRGDAGSCTTPVRSPADSLPPEGES